MRPAIAPALAPFIREAAAAPFAFGDWDCSMFLANWIRAVTGFDPAAELRGRYRTRLGWLRLVTREGGLEALVGRLVVAAGMTPIAIGEACLGDVALAELPPVERGRVGAILAGDRWIMKLAGGLTAGRPRIVRAWGFR